MRTKVKNMKKAMRQMCQGKPRNQWATITSTHRYSGILVKLERQESEARFEKTLAKYK